MRALLLNPGPVSLTEGVRRAAVSADLCHREEEYFDLQQRVIAALLRVYDLDPEEWAAVPLGGSGTTAMEAMLASLLPEDAKLLVVENGVYGERLKRIAEIHRITHDSQTYGWTDPICVSDVESRLASGAFTHLAVVHHETTTGRLNPVSELAEVCDRHGVQLLLDAVSSFGAEEVPFDHDAVLACAATANKCLHGIPGLSLVICRHSGLARAPQPRSLYLHLPLWAKQQAQQSTPFTPSVNAFLALDQALKELAQQGGWQARHARYRRLAEQVRRTLQELAIESFLPEAECSSVLRSYHLPSGLSYEVVHDGLKQRGFVIYAGQGDLSADMFRISTMGDISDYDLGRLQSALREVFES
jgi:2-aminoethylphosphonate-pyruvate transaminase